MEQTTSLIIRIFISLACFIFAFLFVKSSRKDSLGQTCGLGEFMMGTWILLDGIRYLFTDPYSLITFRSFAFITSEFGAFFLFLSAYRICIPPEKQLDKEMYILIVFPIIFTFLHIFFKIFNNTDFFFRYENKQITFRTSSFAHLIYCFILMLLSEFFYLYKSIFPGKDKRLPYIANSLAVIVLLTSNLYKFAVNEELIYSFKKLPELFYTFGNFNITLVIFITVYFHEIRKANRFFDSQFFDSAPYSVIIFNKNKNYVDSNVSAKEFFNSYKIQPHQYDNYKILFPEEKFQQLGIPNSQDIEKVFYLSALQDKRLFYAVFTEIFDNSQHIVGYYLTILKMELYTSVMQQLEYLAYTDSLTNCSKKIVFERKFLATIHNSRTQFLLICASINNLEKVNSELGITKGDMYLKTFVDILQKNINSLENLPKEKQTEIFRMTGTVFVFFVPLNMQNLIPEFFKNIKTDCTIFSKTKKVALSCSLGYSVTSKTSNNVMRTFQKSYENMLLDKK